MAGLYEGDLVLRKQEVGDKIFLLNPIKTPKMNLIRRGKKPKDFLSSWPLKKFADRGFAAAGEKDKTTFGSTNRTPVSAYGMIVESDGWFVGKAAAVVETAGVADEVAEQKTDDGALFALQIEKQIGSDVDTRAKAGSDEYRSRGMFSWLSPTAQGVLPVPTGFRPGSDCVYTGTLAGWIPSQMVSILTAMYKQRKDKVDLKMMCGIDLKAAMSNWVEKLPIDSASNLFTQWNRDPAKKELMTILDVFKFDAGYVTAMLDDNLLCDETTGAETAYSPKSGLLIDPDMWEMAYLSKPRHLDLADGGGGKRGFHDAMYILKCMLAAGQGYVKLNS